MVGSYVLVSLIVAFLVRATVSSPKFPDVFAKSTWLDNKKGKITFRTWDMKGWTFIVGDKTIDNWQIVDNTRFDTDGYLALRSMNTFTSSSKTYYSYVCLKFYEVSDGFYKYNVLHDQLPLPGAPRVKVSTIDDLVSFSDICDTSYINDRADYSIMIRTGTYPKSPCPSPVLGTFYYVLMSPNVTEMCARDGGILDGCDQKEIININNTCNAKIAYSDAGQVSCIDSIEYDSSKHVQILVYNLDETVDNFNTFRISCIRVTEDGSQMTIAPNYCRNGQSPYEFVQQSKVDNGQKLITTKLTNCRNENTNNDTNSDTNSGIGTGVVVAIVASLVLVAVGVVLLITLTLWKRRRSALQTDELRELPAPRLPPENGVSELENNTPPESPTCSICMDRALDCMIIPCGHTFCRPCITQIQMNTGMFQTPECPQCRRDITDVNPMYL